MSLSPRIWWQKTSANEGKFTAWKASLDDLLASLNQLSLNSGFFQLYKRHGPRSAPGYLQGLELVDNPPAISQVVGNVFVRNREHAALFHIEAGIVNVDHVLQLVYDVCDNRRCVSRIGQHAYGYMKS